MDNDFYQILWDSWLDNQLSWSQFNLDDIHDIFHDQYQHWTNGDPTWLFSDSNMFYYPLFGLGSHDSDVAIVAAGPGHNVTEDWAKHTNTAAYRERIQGPVEYADKYSPVFKRQRLSA